MPNRIAFQGESGAYSELAARKYFGESFTSLPLTNFKSVFEALHSGEAEAAVIPIENSLAGSIHENYDWLLHYRLPIIGEIILRISHCLLALPGVTLSEIRRIISHPQALQQCREFLESWPSIAVEPAYDTAGSARRIRTEELHDTAAIASLEAAQKYQLAVLAKAIESNHQNYTRFLVLAREERTSEAANRTTIVFSCREAPGALFKALAVFALRDLNLLKIESRPLHGMPFNYYFYLDFEGSLADEPVRNALAHLREITTFLQVLGSYPKGPAIE